MVYVHETISCTEIETMVFRALTSNRREVCTHRNNAVKLKKQLKTPSPVVGRGLGRG